MAEGNRNKGHIHRGTDASVDLSLGFHEVNMTGTNVHGSALLSSRSESLKEVYTLYV